MKSIIFDSDDMGADHVISDQCQSHDCRDVLQAFKIANSKFKATLFAIPDEMTVELLEWCKANKDWIELAQHGFRHGSNYECEKMTYEEFDDWMTEPLREDILEEYFVKGFKAPGWQISEGIYKWLLDNDWWVADQSYNDNRRPKQLPVYKLRKNSIHTHTWNCVGNGIYEMFDELFSKVKTADKFYFVSEVINEN